MLCFVAALLGYLFLPAIGPFSGRTLSYSVHREAGGSTALEVARCRERGASRWDCPVWDAGGSATYRYRVEMRDRSCWRARKTQPGDSESPPLRVRVAGCVDLSDQLRPLHRLFEP